MRTDTRLRRCLVSLGAAAALLALTVVPGRAAAKADPRSETSLQFVPDSAAFYCSSLRLGEQWKIVVQSRAWKKLVELPAVQMALGFYQIQTAMPDTIPAKLQKLLHDPQWESTRKVLGDMLAHEVFFTADKDLVPSIRLCQELQTALQYGPSLAKLSLPGLQASPSKVQSKLIAAALLEHRQAIRVPALLLGFRLHDPQRAAEELQRWEKELRNAFEACTAPNKGRLETVHLDGHDYLTYTIDGTAVPWDQIPLEQLRAAEDNPGDTDKIVNSLKQLKLVAAVGVRDDYLLLSIASSTEPLASLGKRKLLVDQPEFKPLVKFAPQRLAGVSYVSAPLRSAVANPQNSINGALQMVEQLIAGSKLSSSQQAEITADAAKLAEDLGQLLPEPGAASGFQFLTQRGSETYSYDWAGSPELDGSKPLSLLQHLGGAPLAALVLRGKQSPQGYEFLAKWLPVALKYAEQLAVPALAEPQRGELKQLLALLRKDGARMDQINRTLLFPALADGQSAVLLDNQLRSKQYCTAMPPSDQPLPMIEPALVLGVSDAPKLRQAVEQYAQLIPEYVTAVQKIFGSKAGGFHIPAAVKTSLAAGELFAFPLPSKWHVDEQIVPNAALSEHVAVLSLTRRQSQRLLTATPLAADCLPATGDRPRAGAGYFRCAAFIEMLGPWVDYAADRLVETNPDLKENPGQVKYALDQIHTVIEVLKVFKGVSFEMYFEGPALVEHSRIELEDVQ